MTHRVAGGLVGLVLTVLVVATALRWADIASPWYLIGVQALRWVVGAWCVAALVVAVALRRRVASAVALVLVLVHVALAVPAFRGAPGAAPGDDDLVVMAANLELGRADLGRPGRRRPRAGRRRARAAGADPRGRGRAGRPRASTTSSPSRCWTPPPGRPAPAC